MLIELRDIAENFLATCLVRREEPIKAIAGCKEAASADVLIPPIAKTQDRGDIGPVDRADVQTIRIVAALIDDERGRLLLVRKAGTESFMQAGGKIEEGEDALSALVRELHEEIGFQLDPALTHYLGNFSAPAANESGRVVEAQLFHVRTGHRPTVSAEIAEAIWVSAGEAEALRLAPLTREHVLPLSRSL